MEQKKGCGCNKNKTVQDNVTAGPIIPEFTNQTELKSPIRMTHQAVHPAPQRVEPETANIETVVKVDAGVEFKKREVAGPGTLKEQIGRKMGMVQSFAQAVASRGFLNNKINKPTKQLRVLSCFGNSDKGGQLPPCEYLRNSTNPGKHFCGGCGCGDKPHTWLMAEGEEYSKLDYPKLNCPLQMPGFANYEASKPEEATPPITRRYYIENIDYREVDGIPVSLPEKIESPPPPPEAPTQ